MLVTYVKSCALIDIQFVVILNFDSAQVSLYGMVELDLEVYFGSFEMRCPNSPGVGDGCTLLLYELHARGTQLAV